MRYKEPDGGESRLLTHPVRDRARRARPSDDFRFAAAVAAVRHAAARVGAPRPAPAWRRCCRWPAARAGEDAEGYRGEFIGMVETARTLSASSRTD